MSDYYDYISQTIQSYIWKGKHKTASNFLKKYKSQLTKSEFDELSEHIARAMKTNNPSKISRAVVNGAMSSTKTRISKLPHGSTLKAELTGIYNELVKLTRESKGKNADKNYYKPRIENLKRALSQGLAAAKRNPQKPKRTVTTKTVRTKKVVVNSAKRKANPLKRKVNAAPRKRANYTDFDFDFDKGKRDLGKMFQGKLNGAKRNVLASDLQPNKTVRMGKLSLIKINGLDGSKYELSFDGDAWLSMDRRKNLWFSGKDSRLNLRANGIKIANNQQQCLGYMTQVNYITAKKHIENGATVEYYHKLGEVNKELPTIWVDGDGFLISNGGDYDVWKEGIVN
jgi:hypothetical protein